MYFLEEIFYRKLLKLFSRSILIMQYLLMINNFLSTKRNIFGAQDVYNTYRLERFRYRWQET